MNGFAALIARDISLALRAGGGAAHSIVFFALVVLIFSLAVGPDVKILAAIAAPILWASALLASLVSLDRIFQSDFEDGSLDLIVETAEILELAVLAKAVAHWVTACLPLIVAAPLLAVLVNLPDGALAPLMLSLVAGTPALSLIGAFAAAVALAMRRAGVLMAILAAPLYAPALIFGVGAAQAAPGANSPLLLLTAISLFSMIFAPLAGAAALRLNLD